MNLFIPVVGTKLRLLEPSTVLIKNAGQNERFAASLGALQDQDISITLPSGTLLVVDRVYIRQGDGADFNSLTFRVKANNQAKIPAGRFFLPVDVVNTLNVEIVQAKPAARELELRGAYDALWKLCSYSERSNGVPFDRLLEQVSTCHTIMEGEIQLDTLLEWDILSNAVNDNAVRIGAGSFLTLVEWIATNGDEQQVMHLKDSLLTIREQLEAIDKAYTHSAYESVYEFRLFRFNEQPALWIKPFAETTLLKRIYIAENAYKLIFSIWHTSQGKLVPFESRQDWGSAFTYLRPRDNGDTFGVYNGKSNYSAKCPIQDIYRTQAIIPSDSFVDNMLTRTKNSDHKHQFLYLTASGERITPAQLRKLK